MADKLPINFNKPVVEVYHAQLARFDEGDYKSRCPVCLRGVLLINRDPKSFALTRLDRCVSCAQQFRYMDVSVNGEKLKNERRAEKKKKWGRA